jgi:septal ring factor EnvC (AmiA/AmiB activator)
MKTLFIFSAYTLFFTAYCFAQEHPQKEKQDPIKMLEEIQQKMTEAENLLTRSAVGVQQGSNPEIDKVQETIKRRIERLMQQNKTQEEIKEELDKFLDRKKRQMESTGEKMSEAVKQIDKLLQSEKNQAKCVEQINKILESQEKMQETLQSMDKMFQQITNKHDEALSNIEKLIKMAQNSGQKTPMMMPEDSSPQEGEEKPQEEMPDPQKPLKPHDSEQEQEKEENDPHHPNFQKKLPPKSEKDKENDANDNERWGNLPARARENFNGLDNTKLPAKYKFLMERFHKRLQDLENKD